MLTLHRERHKDSENSGVVFALPLSQVDEYQRLRGGVRWFKEELFTRKQER